MFSRKQAGQLGLLVILILCAFDLVFAQEAMAAYAPLTSTPTSLGVKTVKFTGTSAARTAPAEAFQALDLPYSNARYPGCISQPDAPALDFKPDKLELTDMAMIATCGWQKDETIQVTLMDPSGKYSTTEVKAIPARHNALIYEADLFYQPGGDAPEGFYRFTFQGRSGTVKAKISFLRSQQARMYTRSENPFKPQFGASGSQQTLQLQGFRPNEPVRLLAYQQQGTRITFYAWQDYTIDQRGQLQVKTDFSATGKETTWTFFAYAQETHFVPLERFSQDAVNLTRTMDTELYCPGAQTPILSGTETIRPAQAGQKLEIHYQPGFGSRIDARISGDTPAQVYGYPKCVDHAYWWKVSLKQPTLFGWVAESHMGQYEVEAVK